MAVMATRHGAQIPAERREALVKSTSPIFWPQQFLASLRLQLEGDISAHSPPYVWVTLGRVGPSVT